MQNNIPSGTVIVKLETPVNKGVIIYARVSSSDNKSNLDTQAERLQTYCLAKGYQSSVLLKKLVVVLMTTARS